MGILLALHWERSVLMMDTDLSQCKNDAHSSVGDSEDGKDFTMSSQMRVFQSVLRRLRAVLEETAVMD